ncbi:MAG TPA: Asp23/Gls24 family envelope stress response protein [Clostridiales bacterium]|nr:Asp23/Gls24 family envelope stress response protein [Clostridiales bacterium]
MNLGVQILEAENNINEYGAVKIADDVVAIIAEIAAKEVKGIVGMSGGIADSITEMLGKKSPSKGVKVEVGEEETAIDLYVIVEYGVRIPDVAWQVQENVKKAVETMTGLKVVEVNIHIQGVNLEKENKQEDATSRYK